MAKILYYTSNVSKGMNLENYEEFENSTFKVLGTSVKVMNADGEWKKVKKPTEAQLNDSETKVFMTLDVTELDDLILLEMGVANKCGFSEVIEVNGTSFELKDGATITRMGSTFEFNVA